MAKEKTYVRRAKIANEDLRLSFFFSPAKPDVEPPVPARLMASLIVEHDEDGDAERINARLSQLLSAGDRATLMGLLGQVRDQLFVDGGYVEV